MNNDTKTDKSEKGEKGYFNTIPRIVLIFFLGFSLFLFVSTVIQIMLTRPDREVVVPDLVGKRFINVYNSLIQKGIKPEIKFKNIYDSDDGIILDQSPDSKSVIAENDRLKLTVSRSVLYIDVPDLVGSKLPLAITNLKNFHYHNKTISIETGIISYIPSDKTADNVVLGQSPLKGEKITPAQKINLLVSSGKVKVDSTMPNITGQSIDLCYNLLLAKGVDIHEEIVPTAERKNSGLISAQVPAQGALIKKGARVTIRINWFSFGKHPYAAYEKVTYRIPADNKPGLYEAYIEDSGAKRVRFSRKMGPGQVMEFIFRRIGNAKISIVRDKQNVGAINIDVD